MRNIRFGWRSLLLGSLAVIVGACSEPRQEVASAPPPPPPPPPSAPTRTPPPTRTAQKSERRLRRKPVIALARFASDKALDDVPFGQDRYPESAPEIQIQVDTFNARSPREEKPFGLDIRSRAMLKRELVESGDFVVVERDRILDILREIQFGKTEYVNPDTSPEIGEIMGVQYLLEGSIGRNEDRSFKDSVQPPADYDELGPALSERIFAPDARHAQVRLDELSWMRLQKARVREMRAEYPYGAYLSLYNVRTSEVAAEAFGIGATRLDALRDAVEDLADQCRELAEPPRIACVSGDRVFLDLGRGDGVEVGQRFRYLSQGKVIRNAAGQVIGRDEQDAGVLEITQVEPQMSMAKVVTQTAPPVRGDRVARE